MASNSDSLKEYREKRDFGKTNEPQPGSVVERAPEARFVVQQHDATRMHYDLRLEVDGVLKSWAVPQGPSMDPQVKRLAVETEDHPLEYLDFEGVIPEGEYGAGAMIVWDQGTYTNIRGTKRKPFTMQESYEQGLIEVRLHGQKLEGSWALVRTKFNDAKNSWLMVKMKGAEANPEYNIVTDLPKSIKSGMTIEEMADKGSRSLMHKAFKVLPEEVAAKLQPAEYPGWQDPMLATAADKPFSRANWVFEQKLDGQRCLIFRKDYQVQLVSRNQIVITDQYPDLVAALKKQGTGDFVLDGEIVAFAEGRPSFEEMQKRMHVQKPKKELIEQVKVFLYLFDVTYFEGQDTTRLPLIERKNLLQNVVEYQDPIRFTEHREGDGVLFLAEACAQGLEGLIAKDGNSTYQRKRSNSWLKFKCVRQQEMVVGGYTDPNAGMRGFGALLVGYYDEGKDGKLQFAGKVGTGFNDVSIRDIGKLLKEIETEKNPFAPDPELPKKDVHWVEPKLVAQVGYGEWTSANKVRHPRFLGMRIDKDPIEVVRENTISAKSLSSSEENGDSVKTPVGERLRSKDAVRTVDGHKIKLTNLDKVLFPDDGITKGQVIDYYEQVAPNMLAQIKDRPLSLERFPDGIKVKGFYHKEAPDYFPDYIDLIEVETSDTETQMQSMANNAATLVYLAQMATVTSHHWMSRAADLHKPDKIVFDLDPSDEDSWDVVKDGARDLRAMLKEMGLSSYPMLTGSRGLHVAVPLKPDHDFEAITLFSKAVCATLERRDKKFTTQIRKDKRKGRVFLDYLRNRYAQTAVSPYSLRAKAGAPVATPIDWDELTDSKLRSNHYTIENIFKRLGHKEDPWNDFFKHKTALPDFEMIEKVLGA